MFEQRIHYEEVGAIGAHTQWLDAIVDKVVFYLCDKGLLTSVIDDKLNEKVGRFFAPLILEAKRMMGRQDEVEAEVSDDNESDGEN